MSRISNLKEVLEQSGVKVTRHFTDGPRSGFRPKARAGEENHVMITLDLIPLPSDSDKEKIMMHLFFYKHVHKVHFTKQSERLKVMFNCRSERNQ